MVQIPSLTDIAIRNLKEGEYWDAKLPSFGVRVGKRFTTFLLKKGNRRVKLGRYPSVTLQDARKRVFALKADPTTLSANITFKEALTLFYEAHCAHYRPKVMYETKRYLAKFTLYDNFKLSKLTTQHIFQIIDEQTRAEANKLFTVSRTFFRFCARRRLIDRSPLDGLPIPNKEVSRARVLSDAELKSIWEACEQTTALPSVEVVLGTTEIVPCRLPAHFATIVKLLILTGQRRGEIAALQILWIKDGSITLPSHATKNSREHTFPTGAFCAELLSQTLKNIPPTNGYSKQ